MNLGLSAGIRPSATSWKQLGEMWAGWAQAQKDVDLLGWDVGSRAWGIRRDQKCLSYYAQKVFCRTGRLEIPPKFRVWVICQGISCMVFIMA